LTTQLKQETPIPPLPIGQQRQIARLLDNLAQETHGFFKPGRELQGLASFEMQTVVANRRKGIARQPALGVLSYLVEFMLERVFRPNPKP